MIDDVLSSEPLLEKLSPEEAGDWSTGTSYELKFLKTGRPIQKAIFRRRVPRAPARFARPIPRTGPPLPRARSRAAASGTSGSSRSRR